MITIYISVAVFVGVTLIVMGLSMLMRDKPVTRMEDRLNLLTSKNSPAGKDLADKGSVLAHPLDDSPSISERFFQRFGNMNYIFEQADTSLTLSKLLLISIGMAIAGGILGMAIRIMPILIPQEHP